LVDHQIKIEHIRLKALYQFARGILVHPGFEKVAPVTLFRALAQEKNPYAHPDDVVLLVAYEGNQCIGYHGILPGRLQKHGHFFNVHWATTFFVAPEYRGKGVGKQLLNEIQKLHLDVVVTGMTQDAQMAYQRMNFKPLGHVTYNCLRVEKMEWFKKVFYRILLNRLSTGKNDIECREVDQLTTDLLPQATSAVKYSKFYRGIEAINWMIHYPWVRSSRDLENKINHYHFSQHRDLFKYIALEIYSRSHALFKGYLVLSVSRYKGITVLKILDFYFQHPNDQQIAGFIALKYASRFLADRIDIPSSLSNFFQRQPLLRPLIKKQKRLYLFYPQNTKSPLAESADNMMLNYCDGDVTFT